MLDIITGRNQQAPTIKKALVHDGREYDISSGGNFKLSKIAVDVETIDEKQSQFQSQRLIRLKH